MIPPVFWKVRLLPVAVEPMNEVLVPVLANVPALIKVPVPSLETIESLS